MTPPVHHGHELAMRLRAAYSFFRRRSSARLAPLGLSSDQFVLLTVLERQGPATQQDLVRRCYSDTTTIGTMLLVLESKGLIKREAHAQDGRAWLITLTESGREIQRKLWQDSEPVRSELSGLFSPEELDAFLIFLERIIDAMPPQTRPRKNNLKSPKRTEINL